jgi:hypothetical protein
VPVVGVDGSMLPPAAFDALVRYGSQYYEGAGYFRCERRELLVMMSAEPPPPPPQQQPRTQPSETIWWYACWACVQLPLRRGRPADV